MRPCHTPAPPRRQRGVYALEWAIIFPVFFLLVYAILCYGLSFLVRASMQHAVEEGARAALRYPVGKSASDWNDRKLLALQAVQDSLDWLPPAIRPTDADIRFTVCRVGDAGCNADSALVADLGCDAKTPCLILVSYAIQDYQSSAIAPAIPGFGLVLPSTLQATASILMDRELL
ncbi:TadE/TadG family type IV pilus assembly protein [Comamonas antarctica]|uniref:TadE/TadG family type IV pilus assembly protein n=1 Tax=Comamonas antarctica TaxID=2743470 RepID=UPI0028E414DB|nr:TadE/TadG family type IV pilus assembly protein [Comamonas antarctica]